LSWRPAIVFTAAIAILLPFYLLYDQQFAHEVRAKVARANILDVDSVSSVTMKRGNDTVKFESTADGRLYKVVTPPGAFVPQDLMKAITSLLIKSNEVDIISENTEDLTQYGLDHPSGQMELETPGKPQSIKLVFGNDNPTRTAIYARVEGSKKVFLLGLDLKYYQDLMFEWVHGKQGKKAT
jgi:hypothetical protein